MKQLCLILSSCILIASCATSIKPTIVSTSAIVETPCTKTCNIAESGICLDSCSVSTIESNTITTVAKNETEQDRILITNTSQPLKIGVVNHVNFILINKNNQQIKSSDLEISHTKKVHIMLIDPTLTEYQHIHPILIKSPNSENYTFDFTPKSAGYIMWANITTTNGTEEYLKTTLGNYNNTLKPNETINNATKVGPYKVNIVFDGDVKKDTMTMLIAIITKNGKPVKNLQPIMNASAHIAVFTNNGQTLIHTHPEENANAKKGIISFHLYPKTAGYAKMFVQFQVGGTEYFAPFGFKIQE